MGNGNWAGSPNYAVVAARLQRHARLQRATGAVPADILLFGHAHRGGPCPVWLRQPGRAIAATPCGSFYVLSGDGNVSAYNGAPGSVTRPSADTRIVR